MTDQSTPRSEAEGRAAAAATYSTDLSLLPAKNDAYTSQMYWDDRYSRENKDNYFDWCLRPDILLPIMSVHHHSARQSAATLPS